ncbi:MAG TPA: MoxR family ATPase [Candidatus Methylacidiphilales bacterium]|nr:MoxR family ATPase [Candidatus Methylacidiphilales bacterium]
MTSLPSPGAAGSPGHSTTTAGSIDRVLQQLNTVILGKDYAVRIALACLLARGHLLIEDLPGVGKTTLAQALTRSLGLSLKRIQFTNDLLPADILGNSIFDQRLQKFVFHPGPIFSQVVLADEVNRATPKTQSALLEAMEEGQVTIDGISHPLPTPFFVIATQNPRHQIGTYPLPESQLDRFRMRLELGFPDREAERRMLLSMDRRKQVPLMDAVIQAEDLVRLQDEANQIHVSEPILEYLLDILAHSRANKQSGAGLSPRAGIALQRSAQAWALMQGRRMLIPEDIQAVAPYVMSHRLSPWSSGSSNLGAAEDLLRIVPVPT